MLRAAKLKDDIKQRPKGLTQNEADALLKKYGPNELIRSKKTSAVMMFSGQFKDFIVIVLMAATAVSFLMGEVVDAVAILVIILMNAILGFIQEYRTEKSLEALKELSAPHARVIRDGMEKEIMAREIVPGDLIILEAGDIIPADSILVEGINVQLDESILTGESIPVEKIEIRQYKSDQNAPKKSILYMGTIMTSGRGKALVTDTGMHTEMGQIAYMLENVDQEITPLQKRLQKIGKQLVFLSFIMCILVIIAGILHGEAVYNMILSGISLAVAAIPEGLPAAVTVSLAIGVQRMLKRNALIRRLPAVETLGCTDVICSDKTGTLTENKMTVKKLYLYDSLIDVTGTGYETEGQFIDRYGKSLSIRSNNLIKMLLTIGFVCNNAVYNNGKLSGDPTELAILITSIKADPNNIMFKGYRRILEIPFDSDRKRMSVVCKDRLGNTYIFMKGAPDKVIPLCSQKLDNNGETMFSSSQKRRILSINEQMAQSALRVLAFAYKRLDIAPYDLKNDNIEKGLVFVGLQGMIDPPREEAGAAIKDCYRAGIRPVMITGDHRTTAVAIANELNMNISKDGVLTGDDIENMDDHELEKRVHHVSVFARVTPKHKLRIVRAFKNCGNIVGMTGDGVNDAPALKEANIGIAMGKNGTDVAKEASAMILLDDNFATIVAAIKEGRIIYDNIRKFIRYLLACNFSEILLMGIASFFGLPMPLIPIQILWINLVTDGLPALALGVDPPDQDIMHRSPRNTEESIFSRGLGMEIAFSGLLMGISSIAAFMMTMYLTGGDILKSRTVAFATIIVAELLYAFESRSEYQTVFDAGFFENKYLVGAVMLSFLFTLLIIYTPVLSAIFNIKPLTYADWALVLGFSMIGLVVNCLK